MKGLVIKMDNINVLLWGAGADCVDNLTLLPENWNILAIVDSDRNKWGRIIEGIQVVKPSDVRTYNFDYILITSSNYKNEIKRSIKLCGISMLKVLDGARSKKVLSRDEHRRYYEKLIEEKNKQLESEYYFENRSMNRDKLLYVLAGYKPKLWPDVFTRMKKFIPADIDVCILSSGKYIDSLSNIAAQNGWSYLSTTINDVAIIQNIAIRLFPKALYIYKMDEDIYMTHNCCEKMLKAYEDAANSRFRIGFVGPMIPLHTNGYLFLKRFCCGQAFL